MQTGTAGDHDDPARRLDAVENGHARSLELGDRVLLGGVGDVDEVIPESFLGVRVRFGRADVHAAKHLHRVDRQDLRPDAVGDRLSDLGLPGCGGAEYGDDAQTIVPSR